jgi:hypothetical protein
MSEKTMNMQAEKPVAGQAPVSRRVVLGGAVAAGTALAFGGAAVLGSSNAFATAAGSAAASAEFLRVSEFVTGGKPLAPALAARFQASLVKLDPGFSAGFAALQTYVAGAGAANIDDLLERPDLSEPLKKSITQIVSAWYLGIVSNDTDAELVSYAEALMYRPTIDVIVVPSYGGGPDSWGQKPPVSTVSNAVLAAALVEKKKTP